MKPELTDTGLRGVKPPVTGRLRTARQSRGGTGASGNCRRRKDVERADADAGWQAHQTEARHVPIHELGRSPEGRTDHPGRGAARWRSDRREEGCPSSAREAQAAEATVSDRLTEWEKARTNDPVKPWSPRHAAEIARLVKHDIPPNLIAKPLTATTRAEWTALVSKKRKAAPAAASNFYRALSAFLNYAEASGWISAPLLPRKGAAMLAPAVASRERVLTDEELVEVWKAANREAPKPRAFVRLLILTAARESEAAGIMLGEIDLAAGRWTIPADRSKNKQPITLPLCRQALDELQAVWPNEQHASNWRLLGRSGTAAFSGFSKLKERVDITSGVTEWRWHDLRRTARTGMTRLGISRDHAEAAINHVSGRSALERTYDRHDYSDEIVTALTAWQSHVASLLK